MSNARNIARLVANSSGILSSNNVDSNTLSTTFTQSSIINKLGYTPVNKAGDVIDGILRIRHAGGGEWAMLGSVFGTGAQYIHVKTSLTRDSYKMVGFKMSGFFPYNAYGEGFLGCYTYGTNTGSEPYGVIAQNQGNHSVASGMYYSSDNYVVLRLNWSTDYNGCQMEYISAGQSFGNIVGISILAYTKSNSTTGVY